MEANWRRYIAELREIDGLMIIDATAEGGRFRVTGMRDPLAPNPDNLLSLFDLAPAMVESDWADYHSLAPAMVLTRAIEKLAPPDSVNVRYDDATLVLAGFAAPDWISEAERIVRALPGIDAIDRTQLVERRPAVHGPVNVGALTDAIDIRSERGKRNQPLFRVRHETRRRSR